MTKDSSGQSHFSSSCCNRQARFSWAYQKLRFKDM